MAASTKVPFPPAGTPHAARTATHTHTHTHTHTRARAREPTPSHPPSPPQVDDIFLSTDDLKGSKYRTTPEDLKTHVTWQDQISAKLPPGSLVRAEMVRRGLCEGGGCPLLLPCTALRLGLL